MEIELPKNFNLWARRDRIKWHTERARKICEAESMLKEVITERPLEEVEEELEAIRYRVNSFDGMIRLLENPKFCEMRQLLRRSINTAKVFARKRGNVICKQIESGKIKSLIDKELELKQSEEQALEEARQLEIKMGQYAGDLGCDATPFLELQNYGKR